jgi:hypothetical protein
MPYHYAACTLTAVAMQAGNMVSYQRLVSTQWATKQLVPLNDVEQHDCTASTVHMHACHCQKQPVLLLHAISRGACVPRPQPYTPVHAHCHADMPPPSHPAAPSTSVLMQLPLPRHPNNIACFPTRALLLSKCRQVRIQV